MEARDLRLGCRRSKAILLSRFTAMLGSASKLNWWKDVSPSSPRSVLASPPSRGRGTTSSTSFALPSALDLASGYLAPRWPTQLGHLGIQPALKYLLT